jgi:hypothetical protein
MITDAYTNEQYHAHPAISSSDVKAAMKSLAHWKGAKRGTSAALEIGTAFHDLVLEGGQTVLCGPETRRGSVWKDAKAEADAAGKTLLTEGEYYMVSEMAESCLRQPRIHALVRHPEAMIEQSIFVTCPETGLELKCRPDCYVKEKQVCLDLKSTVDAGPHRGEFEKQVWNLNYHVQGAFYAYVLKLAGLPVTYFAFAAVEKTPPYATCLHVLSGDVMEYAHDKMMNGLRRIKRAEDEGKYPTDWPELNMIHLPEWMKLQDE